MLSAVAWISAALLAVALCIALRNVRRAPVLERYARAAAGPRVSVLVPVRDEAANLRAHLPSLLCQGYANLEVVVLDDASSDGSLGVAEEIGGAHPASRLRCLSGEPLPPGWTGKSWACHQLARQATGDIFLFCDADVRAAADAVGRTVASLAEADAVTCFPRQRVSGWADAAVVPLVAHLPVVALLPLDLVPRVRSPALSVGNGQWLAMWRAVYRRAGGHAAVAGTPLEDVELARRIKGANGRLLPLLAARTLEVRMYRGWSGVTEGFGKNVYALAGGTSAGLAAALTGFVVIAVVPWAGVALGYVHFLPALLLLIALRVAEAKCVRTPLASLLLHPVGSLLVVAVALRSWRHALAGTASWKGRLLPTTRRMGAAGTIPLLRSGR